ncbi:MAG: hypothetical protein ABI251_15995, partial [Mycobacteriaceae bacterium]
KKDAQQNAAAYICEQLQNHVERDAKKRAKKIATQVNDYLGHYQAVSFSNPDHPGHTTIPFNAQGAFAGGLAGVAGVGGLALWASTLGNLGAYIIAAKAASVAAGFGLSLGGSVAWTTALAAIGGPVTVGVGIVVIATVIGWSLLRGSWESRLAKKVSEQFLKQGLEQRYLTNLETFWNQTAEAFSAGADRTEEDFQHYLDDLRRLANHTDEADIKSLVTDVQKLLENFADLRDHLAIAEPLGNV